MTEKDIAKQILASVDLAKNEVEGLKVSIQNLLVKLLGEVKKISGSIPDEETFLKVVAELIDEMVVLPYPYEAIDGYVAGLLLKVIDKQILDRFLGEDWFDKLKAIIGEPSVNA